MTADDGDQKKREEHRAAALHSMPSANAEDAIIVNTPHKRGFVHGCARLFAGVTAAIVVVLLIGVLLIDAGIGDGPLTNRAQILLQDAVGDRFIAKVDAAGFSFAGDGRIAIEARGVRIYNSDDGEEAVSALEVRIALHVLPLLSGHLSVSHIEIDGGFVDIARLDLGNLMTEATESAGPFRIDNMEAMVNRTIAALRAANTTMERRETDRVVFKDWVIAGLGQRTRDATGTSAERVIDVTAAEITTAPDTGLDLDARISFGGQDIHIDARTLMADETAGGKRLTAEVTGVHVGDMIREFTGDPKQKFRLESSAQIEITAQEASDDTPASLHADLQLGAGELFMDGVAAELKRSDIRLMLDPDRKSLEFRPSRLNIGASSYSFNGGIIDLDNLPGQSEQGFGIDLLVDHAILSPRDSSEAPVAVAMKAFARYVKAESRLYIDDFIISGTQGAMFSSASIRFTDTSPEVSFVANVEKMDTATVKQLWPYWLAKQPRRWVHQNAFGGTVTDGSIRIFIPEGRMAEALPGPMRLDHNQLQIAFDIEDARFDVAGDIPPVREANGTLTLRGPRFELAIDKGKSYFPTGRTVEIAGGSFLIPQTDAMPLMAHLDISVSGDASAVAELSSYRPINALERTSYQPEDFDGPVTSQIDVVFGVIQNQNPPSPDWKVEIDLDGVSVGPPIDGVKVSDAGGKMFVDPEKIVFDTDAALDGMVGHLDFTEPLDTATGPDRDRTVSLTMDNADRAQFAAQLNQFIDGTISVTAKLHDDRRQEISVDLTEAKLMLPWIGWSKGKGIQARATFVMTAEGAQATGSAVDGTRPPEKISIDDMVITGEGFSMRGSLRLDKGELVSATITQATLNRNDSFSARVARSGGAYKINVSGRAVDLRSAIKTFMSETDGGASGTGTAPQVEIVMNADRATGFGNEVLSDFKMDYVGRGSRILSLDLTASTSNGLPIEVNSVESEGGSTLTLKSANAGITARFLDTYDKIEGGTLNATLRRQASGPYLGTIEIRDFDIVGEERLRSLVSSRSEGGQSLNQAAGQPIEVGHVHFDVASAKIDKGVGYLKLSDGIARGSTVGFAFQGTVYDKDGRMDITGTFMPAYGLNRIFGEIPIIGALLGNRRERALIGITFRLTGSLDDPKLAINPISAIAPGVFRSIFEFRPHDGSATRSTVAEPSR